MVVFNITCPVEAFAEITPSLVRFQGFVDADLKRQVRVTPAEKTPFKIIGSNARDGRNIKFEVKETMESGRPGYVVEIENTKKDIGSYHDMIFLKTDSKIRPQLTIRVFGTLTDPTLTEATKPIRH